ncbi:MAG: hypothetical protein IPP67_07195 [Rhodospirillaceae bacterium]|nr:hypothetical protein [Rhodospirillaceae bacterium]
MRRLAGISTPDQWLDEMTLRMRPNIIMAIRVDAYWEDTFMVKKEWVAC